MLGKELRILEMKQEKEEELRKRRIVQYELNKMSQTDKRKMEDTIFTISKQENFKNKATEKIVKERLDECVHVEELLKKKKKENDEDK